MTMIEVTGARTMAAPRAPKANAATGPGDSLSTLINLAGRQRMLSQRVVLQTLLSAQGDGAALAVAQEALELLRFSHERLLKATATLKDDVSAPLQQALHGPQGAHKPVQEFVRLAEQTLAAIAHSQPASRRMVPSLVARSTPLLAVLNDLTQTVEMLARGEAHAQRQRQADLLQQIERIAGEARLASFNARVAAARAGDHGREFGVVAGVLSGISERIEALSKEAMRA